ncbi:MAG: helix-turn-helix domain-containing protein [Alphaproteobacteria bacterium]
MKHPVDVHVGQKIRHRRWLVGMTQQQLASAVGIKFQQIQKYESGANRVSASRLYDISRAMNVPVSYFFEGLEEGAQGEVESSADLAVLQDKETAEVIRAYYAIRPETRRRLLDLARALAEDGGEAEQGERRRTLV